MSLKVSFQVHNPHRSPNAAQVQFKGKQISAVVDTFEVELKALDTTHGGLKLRFTGDEVAAAEALFVNDAMIEVTFDAAPAAAAPAAAPTTAAA